MVKRLFVGTFVDDSTRALISKLPDNHPEYKTAAKQFLRLVKSEKLHMTWSFLGDVEDSRIPQLISKLETIIAQFNSINTETAVPNIIFTKVSFWPYEKDIRTVVLTAESANALFNILAQNIREALPEKHSSKNVPVVHKEFKPHITVARTSKPPSSQEERRELVAILDKSLSTILPIDLRLSKVCLLESHFGKDATGYERLAEFSLGP